MAWLGYAAQLVYSAIVEREPSTCDEISNRAGREQLPWLCESADACSRVDRDSPDARTIDLGLADMNAAS